MLLSDIKDIFQKTAINHKLVNTFDFGEQFEAAINGNYKYPAIFFELPILVTYPQGNTEKTLNFAIDIYDISSFNNKDGDYDAISLCEKIGDAYFSKLSYDNKTKFRLSNINATTFRNQTDDDLAGIRYELTLTTKREYCNDNFLDEFNKKC